MLYIHTARTDDPALTLIGVAVARRGDTLAILTTTHRTPEQLEPTLRRLLTGEEWAEVASSGWDGTPPNSRGGEGGVR